MPAPIISNCNIVNGEFDVKTIGDVANAYVAWCFKHRSDKHGLDSRSVFRHFAEFLGRDSLIINLTAGDFAAYRKHCLKTIGSRFNKHMRIIKAAFRRCRREQWLCVSKGWLEDMLDPLELKTIVSEEWDIFKPHEFKLILGKTPDQLEVIITLALNCALGNKDIAALQWRDIDFERGILDYRRPKTHKMRKTPLWPETIKLINYWKKVRNPTVPDGLVFTTRNGNPWVRTIVKGNTHTPDNGIGKEFTKILNNLGIKRPRLSFYSIRHTATTWATEYAENDQLVKEGNEFLLGHAPDEMWKRYSHAIPPSLKQAVAAIRRGWLSAYSNEDNTISVGNVKNEMD